MGTRSLTIVLNEDKKPIVCLYRQYDGYPRGHGEELSEFIGSRYVCNGFSDGERQAKAFNGMGCFAAALVAYFKTDIGEFYLHPPDQRDVGEEYVYTLSQCKPLAGQGHKARSSLHLKIEEGYGSEWKTIFDDEMSAFPAFIEKVIEDESGD